MQILRSSASRVTHVLGNRRASALIFALGFSVLLSACASADHDGRRSGGRGRPVQPRLAESTTFFDGVLRADVSLEPITFGKPGDERVGPGGGPGGRHRRNRGGGYPDGGGRPEDFGGGDDRGDSAEDAPMRRIPIGAPPTMELRAKFTNNSEAPVEFAVPDFVSPLGNYAVRPEKLTLAPHAIAELDPMPAVYPDTVTELTVNIRVRMIGKSDSKSVTLRGAPLPAPSSH